MPGLSKKTFALKTKAKATFKPPTLNQENIEKMLTFNEASNGLQQRQNDTKSIFSSSTTQAETKKQTSKRNFKRPKLFEEVSSETCSEISNRMNDPQIKEEYLDFVKSRLDESSDDIFPITSPIITGSSDTGICLSQEILNSNEMKEKYLKFWKESVTDDLREDIQKFSQELQSSGPKKKNKKKEPVSKQNHENADNKENIVPNTQSPKKRKKTKETIPTKKNKNKRESPSKVPNKDKKQIITDDSDEENTLTLYEKMCVIQESRNVGLYVYCDTCDKARYLPHVKDPLDLPEKWYCSMNPDEQYNKCTYPEQQIDEEEEEFLIHNKYNAGSIVWAKVEGYPWWPAMVEDDPDTETYFWLDEGILEPTWYHVTFFDSETVTRAWLTPSHIEPFKINMKNPKFKLSKFEKFQLRINRAIAQAKDALTMELLDRFKKYSFINRFNKIRIPDNLVKTLKQKEKVIRKRQLKAAQPKTKNRKRILQLQYSSSFENPRQNSFDLMLENNVNLQANVEDAIDITMF